MFGRISGVGAGVVAQEPYDHRRDQNHAAHLAQILRALVPHMPERRFPCRQAVGRQLHDERRFVHREHEPPHQPRREDGQHDAQHIESDHHQPGILGKEGAGQKQVDRNSRAA